MCRIYLASPVKCSTVEISNLKAHLVLVVTSETSLLDINGKPSIIRALKGLHEYWTNAPVTICVEEKYSKEVDSIFKAIEISYRLNICNVRSTHSIAASLNSEIESSDILVIHDGSRPQISFEDSQKLMKELRADVDAVRPFIPFTETLKYVNDQNEIDETLDRDSVRRVSTPQIIRTSAIDSSAPQIGWFVPLTKNANIASIEGNPEGLRINSAAENICLNHSLHKFQSSLSDYQISSISNLNILNFTFDGYIFHFRKIFFHACSSISS